MQVTFFMYLNYANTSPRSTKPAERQVQGLKRLTTTIYFKKMYNLEHHTYSVTLLQVIHEFTHRVAHKNL
jgi:hypothetical protein